MVRKRFSEGWLTHIPLTFLTNAACSHGSMRSSQDLLSIDESSRRLVSTSQSLSDTGETDLTYEQWLDAYDRFLGLVLEHIGEDDANAWETHQVRICRKPDRAQEWPLWLAYDIEVRRQSCETGLDPAVEQDEIFRYCQRQYLTSLATRPSFPPHINTSNQSTSRNQPFPSNQDGPRSSFRSKANGHQPHRTTSSRCFFCGSYNHAATVCVATTFSNGRPLHLRVRKPNDKPRDSQNRAYCFPFNTVKGCGKSAAQCNLGEHLCSLCGEASHHAQRCLTST